MTELELASSIVKLLPQDYQECMIFALASLKNSEQQDAKYRFKQFTIILHLNLYPGTKEYSDMSGKSFSYWLDWGTNLLAKLQRKQAVSA